MAHPRRSNDSQLVSTTATTAMTGPSASSVDEFRGRSSSEATPKTRTPFIAELASGQGRRPSKPSLSGSSSVGMGGSDNIFAPGTVSSGQHLGIRSGSRAEMYPARDAAVSPVPSTSGSLPRPSPQKPQRTLDNKIISRELERLGLGVSHIHGGASSSTLAAAASASTLSLPTGSAGMSESRSAPMLTAASSSLSFPSLSPHDTPLGGLHIQVLPLFNGEPLRSSIEELNILVREHLKSVLSRSPSKAMATLAADVTELVGTGMLNLDAKLTGIDDEKFLTRLVEVWNFFWVQVLPYIEGIFLPLQTDPLLLSLGKAPKGPRRNSSSSCGDLPSTPEAARLDVRRLVLVAFRDAIVLPRVDKLQELLNVSATTKDQGGIGVDKSDDYQRPRIQQMLLVLHSTSGTMTQESPTPGEYATQHLLRMIRPHTSSSTSFTPGPARNAIHRYDYPLGPEIHPAARAGRTHPLSDGMASLAASAPRDRRGRIVKLDTPGAEAWRTQAAFQESDDEEGDPSSPTAHRGRRGQLDDLEELVTAGDEDEGDGDLDADDESELGQPVGSTTPTLTRPNAHSRSKIPPVPMPNGSRWDRRHHHASEEEDEDEDYGQPVQRTITTSPLPMPNRV